MEECNKCGKEMKCLGNVSGLIFTSYPEQWDDVYACDDCKTKRTVRKHGSLPPNYGYLSDYQEL